MTTTTVSVARRRIALAALGLSLTAGVAALAADTARHAPTADGGLPGGTPITVRTVRTLPPITKPPATRPPVTIGPGLPDDILTPGGGL